MTLHPILALDDVIREYRDHLLTEFRAKDSALKQALERELDGPRFLAQEAFFQAHRPFKLGKRWRDLPLDPRLAGAMVERARGLGAADPDRAYLHQSDAIERLLGPDASPVAVTTGTGSGKTEAFLLPVIQNAWQDATRFSKGGLTALLVYPMNALANDQEGRIREYLDQAGFASSVKVARYDRGTRQAERENLRQSPPHILLTNYMMLEYLLVRPADREGIFANHRCRFLVLDEVHTYRGTLGSNIALLVRRLGAHLRRARQDWTPEVSAEERGYRFPPLLPIGTSATIKSVSEEGKTREEVIRLRDEAVRGFFGRLTGVPEVSIRVLGEELQEVPTPPDATYSGVPAAFGVIDLSDADTIRESLCSLSGLPATTPLADAGLRCRLLWDLNRWLIGSPLSASQIVDRVRAEVPSRRDSAAGAVRAEVEAALTIGAALPEGIPGALRLRAHRLIRGGWKFHRCVDPACGRLYPMGEEHCRCGAATAPLFLCRNCGADYLQFGGAKLPEDEPLRPGAAGPERAEWMLYDRERLEQVVEDVDDEGEAEDSDELPRHGTPRQPGLIKDRPVVRGSFDPRTLSFSPNEGDYPLRVILSPARTRCLCCGGTAGSRNVLTPVALGTSAAVKVIGEGLVEALARQDLEESRSSGKQRLLVFSDSRQDAAHQARFIRFASRYDRMRRRIVALLEREGPLSIQRVVELLADLAVRERDNPYVPERADWIPNEARERIHAWEEAPLLDDMSVNPGYRATPFQLGLLGVRYDRLDEYARTRGDRLTSQLKITPGQLEYVCRCLLDEMRVRGALSREMLRYHPAHPACPSRIREAEWERRVRNPRGYAATERGTPVAYLDDPVPVGIQCRNSWRRPGRGGRSPSLERIARHVIERFGGTEPTESHMVELLQFLSDGSFVVAPDLFGAIQSRKLLQVNAEAVKVYAVKEHERSRCEICKAVSPGALDGLPCPSCHGRLTAWPDAAVAESRHVRRIRSGSVIPLEAREHTAQVPNDVRETIEAQFKAPLSESKVNLLACSPTLEMGIDVGGLDAVVLRNVPPRPDNYAQRGGRAGRRSRVGLVVGYARSTPHDQYFYEHPEEMIAGEIPAPSLSLGNRDVALRHVAAIAFGAAEPGLAGRMVEYVSPRGEIQQEAVDALKGALVAQIEHSIEVAREAWGSDVLAAGGLSEEELRTALASLPQRVQDVVERTARQVLEFRRPLEAYAAQLYGVRAGTHAGELVARLLGIPSDQRGQTQQADDRSAGYPLRRFAEFGILPGYEFPTQPSTLRLLGEEHEEDPLSVERRFGLAQFQPDATVYARGSRWKVAGLDPASPWNPRTDEPTWQYRICKGCGLHFDADEPRCPRCRTDAALAAQPAAEFAGFIARRDEAPVLDEEERFATRNLLRSYAQWDGEIVSRWTAGPGWALRLSKLETVRWLNEGLKPTPAELERGIRRLHNEAKGYPICAACGRLLQDPGAQAEQRAPGRGRRRARGAAAQGADLYGHWAQCPQANAPPRPVALTTDGSAEILRLLIPLPVSQDPENTAGWGLSLAYALRIGIRRLYMLDGPEIESEYEGVWKTVGEETPIQTASLAFVDPSLGGSGYLPRVAADFHLVARRAIEHLDHQGCDKACYRCLKSYQNQRFHEFLEWPLALPVLEALAESAPASRHLQTGDLDDPRPWLDAYAAGVGSPLELKFMRLFEAHGFQPQKQVPISPTDGGAAITVADFAVPERQLAIYVDGAAFHVGNNLRRDRYIRRRLREATPPWRVEELRAKDLNDGRSLVERLRSAAASRQ